VNNTEPVLQRPCLLEHQRTCASSETKHRPSREDTMEARECPRKLLMPAYKASYISPVHGLLNPHVCLCCESCQFSVTLPAGAWRCSLKDERLPLRHSILIGVVGAWDPNCRITAAATRKRRCVAIWSPSDSRCYRAHRMPPSENCHIDVEPPVSRAVVILSLRPPVSEQHSK
jgi:hypothetical protein